MFRALLLAWLLRAGAADEGVTVTPEIVEISAERPWADLTIRNLGASPREVRTGALSWDQEASGAVVLAPADDAWVFPARAVLSPAEARRFRLSVTGSASERERAYRIALRVLDPGSGAEVTALVPAFVAPARAFEAPAVEVDCPEPPRCRVVLANRGSVRIRPTRIVVAARSSRGASEWELAPWWVLAGGTRTYDLDVPPAARAHEVVVTVTVGAEELRAVAPGREARAGALPPQREARSSRAAPARAAVP